MNRTLLLLAALALAPGCYGSSCSEPGTVTFYWRFVGAAGTVAGTFDVDNPSTGIDESGCTIGGVSHVDSIEITVDGTTETVFCTGDNGVPGARLPGFLRGSHPWRIDAIRSNQVVFTASGTADTRTCGDTQVLVDLAAVTPSDLVVYYDVNNQPPSGCRVGGVPITQVSFELRDSVNRIVDSSCASRSPPVTGACTQETANACDPTSLGFTVPSLALGNYVMNYLELWDTTQRPMAQVCDASFVHEGFPVFLNLAPSNGQFCPTAAANPLTASTPAAP
jgi:hypothetical protein